MANSVAAKPVRRQRSRLAYKCRQIRLNWDAYLFLLPFALVFCLVTLAPVITSLWYSFTYYNILEPAEFIGFQNYITMMQRPCMTAKPRIPSGRLTIWSLP